MPSNAGPASTATPAEAPRAQQPAAPGPSAGAAAAGAPAPSSTQPVARGPLTAAEAAEMASGKARGATGAGAATGGEGGQAADDTAPCASDADCTLTRHPPGSSCPSLCVPRAVTRAQAERLEQGGNGAGCVMPMCRPPPGQTLPACVQNRCVEKSAGPSY